eukprot:6890335-Pyramimonas_sp.AAC.1
MRAPWGYLKRKKHRMGADAGINYHYSAEPQKRTLRRFGTASKRLRQAPKQLPRRPQESPDSAQEAHGASA